MASRDLNLLVPSVREKAKALVDSVSFELLIYCTVRDCHEQARLWRQSRSIEVIRTKIAIYEKYGHYDLAKVLRDVGPQHGPHVTKAGPGESWHQYGEAFDAVPIIGGKAAWNVRANQKIWKELGQKATELGLNWGGNWPKWADYPHFQGPPTGNPLKIGRKDYVVSV